VNLTILPTINPPPYDEYRRVIVDAGIKIVETAGSNKAPHLPMQRPGSRNFRQVPGRAGQLGAIRHLVERGPRAPGRRRRGYEHERG
jgi:hypothetical protein